MMAKKQKLKNSSGFKENTGRNRQSNRRPGDIIDDLLFALLCNGHALLEEACPGWVRPYSVRTLGIWSFLKYCGSVYSDLMPAESDGTNILQSNQPRALHRL